MKKNLIVISLVIVIMGMIWLSQLPKGKQLEEAKEKEENILEILDEKNVIKTYSVTDKLLSEDFANLVSNSDAVVKGKVLSVEYEAIEGNAWTKVTFHIDDVFHGDVNIGEVIEIYYLGGYITLDEHIKYYDDLEKFSDLNVNERNNTILQEIVDGEEDFVEKDEELILCIVKTPEESPLPKGSYERLYAAGMLKENGSKYVQIYGESNTKYSISKEKISNIKKLK